MTKTRISSRDHEMLSAYLDGQLSSKEIARLQVHLKDDRQLQMTLEELRSTREALHNLPRLRAPRNFTLTPQMVGRRTEARRPAYPVFGYASLVASLLLAIVFIADRVSFINTAQVADLQSAAQATQMEEMVETMVVESLQADGAVTPQAGLMIEMEAPVPAALEESSQAADSALMESGETSTLPYEEPTSELFAASEAAASESPSAKIAPEETTAPAEAIQEPAGTLPDLTPTPTSTPWLIDGTEVLGVGGGAPDAPRESVESTPEQSATPTPTVTPSLTCTLEPSPLPTDTPLPSETPAPVGEALQRQLPASDTPVPASDLESSVATEQASPSARLWQPSRSLFTAVEIVLGLLVVGSAIIFFYLRKAS